MPAQATAPRARRSELIVRPIGDGRRYVVKDPQGGTYFTIGEQEHYLLELLDGERTEVAICAAFESRFGGTLTLEDLRDFLALAESRALLRPKCRNRMAARATANAADACDAEFETQVVTTAADVAATGPTRPGSLPRKRQSLLYCRYSVFDPDRLFNWLEPKLRFVWTPAFLAASALCIVAALLTVWANRADVTSGFAKAMRWETILLVWVTLVLVTTCHEFAHGLTCKHHGGEVHEVGVLFMMFMPCFYCNVSDAWLIPQKSRRLWITLAGGYCDLVVWSLAVCAWRVTIQNSLLNYLAWVILTICGGRVFFNFNPLMKLDGYYILSDWLEIPNLRQRGWDHWMNVLRWVLWGAPRPAGIANAKAVLLYGMISWTFSLAFLGVMFVHVLRLLDSVWGLFGSCGLAFVASLVVRRLFRGFSKGELYKMLTTRHVRTALWAMGLLAVPAILCLFHVQDRAGGDFQVRPGTRVEIRAPVAGFLKAVHFDEGDNLSQGALIAQLEIPDLTSQIVQKKAAVQESQANLRRLETGSRPEEITEQRHRVERAREWRDMAKRDLERAKLGLDEELSRLEEQIAQRRTELEFATHTHAQSERLLKKGVLAGEQFRAEVKRFQIAQSQFQQALAEKREREAAGTLSAEAELGRREKELQDTAASLALLEAGARPEEIDAERARLARFQEELNYLSSLENKVLLHSPVAGLMTTPRMTEKIGQYFEKGAPICIVEEITSLEAEIGVAEDEVHGVEVGQYVELKARALPLQTFKARVDRIAPIAVGVTGAPQSSVAIYCHVDNPQGSLRSGMTGYGRVYREQKAVASVLLNRLLRYVRTEFWW